MATYRYEVLLFGSNRSRPEIGAELSERGSHGWRVVCGGRDDDGSWSFVLERKDALDHDREPDAATDV